MKITPNISLSSAKLWINIGWFSGDPFVLFEIAAWKVEQGINTIFLIQALKLVFAFGLTWED